MLQQLACDGSGRVAIEADPLADDARCITTQPCPDITGKSSILRVSFADTSVTLHYARHYM